MTRSDRELLFGMMRYTAIYVLVIGSLMWFSVWYRNRSFVSRWEDPRLSPLQKLIADPKSAGK